ncbi:MAG: hypothetical protein HPY85_12230 [Anaerolineae bacterium]|jgi:uncharacterized damage-inducible protein DinB|nr:hypothetical protein [Anaerolineae bacterium]
MPTLISGVMDHLHRSFQLFGELAEQLPESALARSLAEPSNAIGEQLWCVIGARESYARAILNDGWAGFRCSLSYEDARGSKPAVQAALARSAAALDALPPDLEWSDTRQQLLLDWLEHEVQHQGQLIRYLYGLGYRFPDSWAQRWALEQTS